VRLRRELQRLIDFSQDYFALFGLPPRYRFDPDQLDRAYRALQRDIHPDRYAAADESQRRIALQSSARVNQAYQALKDPVGRAQYLLSLRGVDALAETNTALPPEFLERELERREAVADAQSARDTARLDRLLGEVRANAAVLESTLGDHLEAEHWDSARDAVRQLRFLAKVRDDIEAALGDLDA
jgi:molecular chaperone HscB